MVVTDTHVVVTDTQTVVAGTHSVVAGTHTVVADTHTMVADIHRSVLTGREGSSGQNNSVGAISYPSITECLPLSRLKPGQRC
jgi:hypothetical protein